RTHRSLHPFPTRRSSDLEEDDQVLEPGGADRGDVAVAELAQVDAANLGAERAGDLLNRYPSHAPFCMRWVCSSPVSMSGRATPEDRKSTRLNSSHLGISY